MQEMELGVSGQLTYRVDVATGSDFGAGTDANLFCTLIGDTHRSSGEFQLDSSLSYVNKFERGQASTACSASVPAFTRRCNSRVHTPLQFPRSHAAAIPAFTCRCRSMRSSGGAHLSAKFTR
jgi:hypothetical protein